VVDNVGVTVVESDDHGIPRGRTARPEQIDSGIHVKDIVVTSQEFQLSIKPGNPDGQSRVPRGGAPDPMVHQNREIAGAPALPCNSSSAVYAEDGKSATETLEEALYHSLFFLS
jgi:hypothetical protein